MEIPEEVSKIRIAQYGIKSLFVVRWSPRAFSGEALSDEDLNALFEAARWAPSSYNNQSWRFIYAKRGSADWEKFFDLMVDFNKQWTKNAAVLVVVVSKNDFDFNGQPSRTHSFDAGAAWENLALEAASRGIVAHAMEGFDYGKVHVVLGIPEGYTVEAMIALGKRGKTEDLPPQLQEREAPSARKPLNEIVMEGSFKS